MSTPIRKLLEIITQSVKTLEDACESAGVGIPDLHDAFSPPSEAFRAIPAAAEAASLISAAALQLEAVLTPPQVSLYRIVSGHFKSAALRVCLESNVTEILREAWLPHPGELRKGIHVKDIAAKNGQDPEKLARFIRYLATHHVYREVSPNVFANTRISSMLDTLKPIRSGEPTTSPFARAVGRAETPWQYYDRPEQKFRHHRFGIGMRGVEVLQPPDAILQAYEWKSLAPQSLVVDVGGGVGSSCLTLAAKFPEVKFIWNTKMPHAITSGQVKLEAHDFFTRQPQTDATVYLLKQILHDWSDEYCVKILKRLWDAATPETTLLLLGSIIPLACHDPGAHGPEAIKGAAPKEAPAPLLTNYGASNDMCYTADFAMFLFFNAQERTLMHSSELLARWMEGYCCQPPAR
ncbi:S-adenosyl-L-methionine-dependent methyltransferase [Mycena sanguinolenta]|nr:S-adenosyl-L-methionine-dependent methyltransferase [Mycena sanguinolenta]